MAMQKAVVGHETDESWPRLVLSTAEGPDQPGVAEATPDKGTVAMAAPASTASASSPRTAACRPRPAPYNGTLGRRPLGIPPPPALVHTVINPFLILLSAAAGATRE